MAPYVTYNLCFFLLVASLICSHQISIHPANSVLQAQLTHHISIVSATLHHCTSTHKWIFTNGNTTNSRYSSHPKSHLFLQVWLLVLSYDQSSRSVGYILVNNSCSAHKTPSSKVTLSYTDTLFELYNGRQSRLYCQRIRLSQRYALTDT